MNGKIYFLVISVLCLISCGATTEKKDSKVFTSNGVVIIPKDTLLQCVKEAASLIAAEADTIAVKQVFEKRKQSYKISVNTEPGSLNNETLVVSVSQIGKDILLLINLPDSTGALLGFKDLDGALSPRETVIAGMPQPKENFFTSYLPVFSDQKRQARITAISAFPADSIPNKIFSIRITISD